MTLYHIRQNHPGVARCARQRDAGRSKAKARVRIACMDSQREVASRAIGSASERAAIIGHFNLDLNNPVPVIACAQVQSTVLVVDVDPIEEVVDRPTALQHHERGHAEREALLCFLVATQRAYLHKWPHSGVVGILHGCQA